jgi:hypothetical protein
VQEDAIKTDINSLRNHIRQLQTMVEPLPSLQRVVARSAHTRARTPAQRKTDAALFEEFYQVLSQSFRCQCSVLHEVNLGLSDSLEVAFSINEVDSEFSNVTSGTATVGSQNTTASAEYEDSDLLRYE